MSILLSYSNNGKLTSDNCLLVFKSSSDYNEMNEYYKSRCLALLLHFTPSFPHPLKETIYRGQTVGEMKTTCKQCAREAQARKEIERTGRKMVDSVYIAKLQRGKAPGGWRERELERARRRGRPGSYAKLPTEIE
jgi:hypothetical protein